MPRPGGVQDQFGNEFCLITVLSPEQARAVEQAAEQGDGNDHHWRVAAGRTAPRKE